MRTLFNQIQKKKEELKIVKSELEKSGLTGTESKFLSKRVKKLDKELTNLYHSA